MFHRPRPFEDSNIPLVYLAKWSEAALEEGFMPFPRRLMRCAERIFTGDNAIKRLQVVLAIADAKRPPKNGTEFRPPTLGFLAFNVGMEQKEFEEYVRQLNADGMVKVRDDDEKYFDVDLSPLLRLVEELTPEGS